MPMVRKAGRATGRVQGVGFRAFVKKQACILKFTGWVRNETDGAVTMEVQGDSGQFGLLAARIRQGNAFIRVDGLAWTDVGVVDGDEGFKIRK